MITTTKDQRRALGRVFARVDLGISYRAIRAAVQPTFGCDGAIVVHWQGMWLCIERDGYCHT
jgi:hypothetical protein